MVVPPDRLGVCKTVFFTMESNYFLFLFSTPLVSFRVARIWLFVVVPVSRERCRHLQNRIFIFHCKTQGVQKWPFAPSRLFFDFLFSFFHPSQLFFVFFFFRRGGLRFFSLRFQPLSSLFRFFFFVFRPLSSLFRFFFFYASKGLPPWSGRKIDFLHIQTYAFYDCFFRPVWSQILCHLPRSPMYTF